MAVLERGGDVARSCRAHGHSNGHSTCSQHPVRALPPAWPTAPHIRCRFTASSRRMLTSVSALPMATAMPLPDSVDWLYAAGQAADQLVSQQLSGITPVTYAVVLAAGLATSLSPCTLSVLPLTIGYIGGYAARQPQQTQQQQPHVSASDGAGACDGTLPAGAAPSSTLPASNPGVQAVAFSLGLATTLAALGLVSSSLGAAYGAIGDGLPIAVSLLAILMGLNLLEVVPLALPSLDVDVKAAGAGLPPPAQAYLVGLAFALAASPCSTPVLATLLGWVATEQDPVQGAALLLAYTTGYVAPLMVAATATGSIKRLLALRQYSAWITPASGALLIGGGTYTLLSRLVL